MSNKKDLTNISELPDKAPAILSKPAKDIYKHMLPLFKECGCIAVDINSVISFCDVVALKQKAMTEISKTGEVYMNGKILQASPWLSIKNKCIEQEKKLVQDLACAPAVRARIKMEITKGDKVFNPDDLLNE